MYSSLRSAVRTLIFSAILLTLQEFNVLHAAVSSDRQRLLSIEVALKSGYSQFANALNQNNLENGVREGAKLLQLVEMMKQEVGSLPEEVRNVPAVVKQQLALRGVVDVPTVPLDEVGVGDTGKTDSELKNATLLRSYFDTAVFLYKEGRLSEMQFELELFSRLLRETPNAHESFRQERLWAVDLRDVVGNGADGAACTSQVPSALTAPQTKTQKRFLYLVTLAELPIPRYGDYLDMISVDSDVIFLTWKRRFPDVLFSPGGTWAENRNELLREALRRQCVTGHEYLYYIFVDENADSLEFLTPGNASKKQTSRLQQSGVTAQSALRTLEENLLHWEPAMGCIHYNWQWLPHVSSSKRNSPGMLHKDNGVSLIHNVDHVLVAYHREAAEVLLPYFEMADAISWTYSNHLVNLMASAFFNDHRLQFHHLHMGSKVPHESSTRKKGGYSAFDENAMPKILWNSLRPDSPARLGVMLRQPNRLRAASLSVSRNTSGQSFRTYHAARPRRRGSAVYNREAFAAEIAQSHPLWASNAAFWESMRCSRLRNNVSYTSALLVELAPVHGLVLRFDGEDSGYWYDPSHQMNFISYQHLLPVDTVLVTNIKGWQRWQGSIGAANARHLQFCAENASGRCNASWSFHRRFYLELEMPNFLLYSWNLFKDEFTLKQAQTTQQPIPTHVLTICPYTAEWANSVRKEMLAIGNKTHHGKELPRELPPEHIYIPFPLDARFADTTPTLPRDIDVIYTGGLNAGRRGPILEIVRLLKRHFPSSYAFVADEDDPLVTHKGIDFATKLELYKRAKVAVVHNLLFDYQPWKTVVPSYKGRQPTHDGMPFPSEGTKGAWLLKASFGSRRGGSGRDLPQLKSRPFEAALGGCVMLVLRDKFSVIEDWFTEGEDFLYFEDAHDLVHLAKKVMKNFSNYKHLADNAHKKWRSNYTTEQIVRRYITKENLVEEEPEGIF